MTAVQVMLARPDHDDFAPIRAEISLLSLCRCKCGAEWDAARPGRWRDWADWASHHEDPWSPLQHMGHVVGAVVRERPGPQGAVCASCGRRVSLLIDGSLEAHSMPGYYDRPCHTPGDR